MVKGKKLTPFQALIVWITGAFAVVSAVGGAIVMWEDLRPWASKQKVREIELAVCDNTISRYRDQRFQAQINEAREKREDSPDDSIVLSAQEAIRFYDSLIAKEMRDCRFNS